MPETRHSPTTPVEYQSFPLEDVTLRECFNLAGDEQPMVFWSSPDRPPVLGLGAAASIEATGHDRFDELRIKGESLLRKLNGDPDSGQINPPATASPRLFGGLTYSPTKDSNETFNDATFYLPRFQLTESGGQTWLTIHASEDDEIDTLRDQFLNRLREQTKTTPTKNRHIEELSQFPDRQRWIRGVERILQEIRRGKLDKFVLAQVMNVHFDRPLTQHDLLSVLFSNARNTYRFLFQNHSGENFVGASPETLIMRRGNTIETESLAGTVEAGESTAESRELARELAGNPKNQREHEYVLDTIREQLTPFTTDFHVGDQTVKSFPSVQHLYTPIEGQLAEDTHVLQLVERLHPTPAVGGSPADVAENRRGNWEDIDRDWYASPVGWFDADGNGRFAVAIRSARIDGRDATLYAGAGIVEDSQPEKEWDEVQWKYQSLLDLLQR